MVKVYEFQYVVFGDIGVGKSCLTTQFDAGVCEPQCMFQFVHKRIKLLNNPSPFILYIWDYPCGWDKIIHIFFSYAAGGILVYDITRRETFDNLVTWLEVASKVGAPNLSLMLIGNKHDESCKRAVTTEEGKEFAEKNGLMFMEVSAKTRHNVDQVFFQTTSAIYNKIRDGVPDIPHKVHFKNKIGLDLVEQEQRDGIVEMVLKLIKMVLKIIGF